MPDGLIKTSQEIELLKVGGSMLARVVANSAKRAIPGASAQDLDHYVESAILKLGGEPSFKGFQGYPAATCISINSELVHAIPHAGKVFQEGDIVSIDIGLKYRGLFTDMAVTVAVGAVSKQARRLVAVTKKSLERAISSARAGNTIGDIGHAVQSFVEPQGYSVVRSLVGHGVGYQVHEEPRVPNYGKPGTGIRLKAGMVLALEPMVNIGKPEVMTGLDGWTISTADGSLCAHFEHTIAITSSKPVILTVA